MTTNEDPQAHAVMSGLTDIDWEGLYRQAQDRILFLEYQRADYVKYQDKLADALLRYGCHPLDCASRLSQPCSCGLDPLNRLCHRLRFDFIAFTKERRRQQRLARKAKLFTG